MEAGKASLETRWEAERVPKEHWEEEQDLHHSVEAKVVVHLDSVAEEEEVVEAEEDE